MTTTEKSKQLNYDRKISIKVKYWSDFQQEVFDQIIDWCLFVIEKSMKEKHKDNCIIINHKYYWKIQ